LEIEIDDLGDVILPKPNIYPCRSSWFGFSLVLNEQSIISRSELVKHLTDANIECRPIVTGNFLKNHEVLNYFDYEVAGEMVNADYIDKNGLFIGNHHVDLKSELEYLQGVVTKAFRRAV
jgi:dTDP-4-amino-4,6-dideoxygalactose transaminase